MLTGAGELTATNAHQAQITCLEVGQVGTKLLIFSGSLDGTIKAWDKNESGQFECAGS